MLNKILLATIVALAPATYAATLSVLPSFQSVALGSQAVVTIQSADAYVGDFDLTLEYDTSILSLASLAFGTQLGGPADSLQINASAAGIAAGVEVSFLPVPDLLALQPGLTATLLTLRFNTLSIGTSALTLGVNAIGDETGTSLLPLTLNDGSIQVFQGTGAVPEPSSFVLMVPALGLLALKLRRRSQ